MSNLKNLITEWLLELEENKAATFLDVCEIHPEYITSGISSDGITEIAICKITINVPLLKYRKINEFNDEKNAIQNALGEIAETYNIYISEIDWEPYLKDNYKRKADKRAKAIKEILTQDYVDNQIRLMNKSIEENPHLSLGIAKELIETCCKHILSKNNIEINSEWKITKLVKETNKQINLIPFHLENKDLANSAISKILSGFSNIVHGITELRNFYGSGHGHLPEFKSLDVMYVKLAVSASIELALLYLTLDEMNNKEN